MSEQVLDNGQHREGDLNIFKGMEGFEDLTDDSILVALLDDLQEETLMTLMDDSLLVEDIQFKGIAESSYTALPSDDRCVTETPICSRDLSSEKSQDVHNTFLTNGNSREDDPNRFKRQRNDSDSRNPKRVKLEKFTCDSLLKYDSTDAALTHIMHDHCYASALMECNGSVCHSNINSDEETGNEEGSSSDTGV